MEETKELTKIFESLEVGEKVVIREEEENGGIRERKINREVVDMYKLGNTLPKIMKVMEDERLNIAEAEMIPELLEKRIKRNSELHEKAKQFTVHEKLLR